MLLDAECTVTCALVVKGPDEIFLVKNFWICGIITHVWAEFVHMLRKAVVFEALFRACE